MSRDAIAGVGETLVELLKGGVDSMEDEKIVLMSPADAEGKDFRITLFLYSVVEFPEMKNEPPLATGAGQVRRPPLKLNLHYLLTSHPAPPGGHNEAVEAHRVLGRAMQIFYDNGILTGSVLHGELSPDEELRLTLNPITVEDLTRIWSVFPNSGYHPSVSYLVSPVRIDSERSVGVGRVRERRFEGDQLARVGGGPR